MNGWSKEDLEEMCGDDIIDQLAFVSGCHQHELCNSNPSGWIIPEESLRKFAELIIRECAYIPIDMWDKAELNADVAVKIEDRIKQHFGVE